MIVDLDDEVFAFVDGKLLPVEVISLVEKKVIVQGQVTYPLSKVKLLNEIK